MDIIFSESGVNFDWNKIMGEVRTQVRNNANKFIEEGGWDFLQPSASENGENGDGLEEGDSAFSMSDSEFVRKREKIMFLINYH